MTTDSRLQKGDVKLLYAFSSRNFTRALDGQKKFEPEHQDSITHSFLRVDREAF